MHQTKTAFTLIELIVVIAIIATLAGAIFVAINPAKRLQDSRNAERRTATTSLLDAIKKYQADNDGSLPSGIDSTLRMVGTASSGCTTTCGPGTTGTTDTISVRVTNTADDAEEQNPPNGNIYRWSSDLELTYDGSTPQVVAMRFRSIDIPQGATITEAYLTFTVEEANSETTNLIFYGEDIDDSPSITTSAGDITARTKTSASVNWSGVPSWDTIGETKQTPDISPVIQEIINRTGWTNNNDLMIIVEGTGERSAESRNGSSTDSPLLTVTYSTGTAEQTATACLDIATPLDPYLPNIPLDPQDGTATQSYYAVKLVDSIAIQVTACSAEDNATIQTTR